jgi:hypothetical protein
MSPIDPMSPEAQDMMEEYAELIVRHAKLSIHNKKLELRELNTFYQED